MLPCKLFLKCDFFTAVVLEQHIKAKVSPEVQNYINISPLQQEIRI